MFALNRRSFLGTVGFGISASMSGFLGQLASVSADSTKRKRSCILLWLNGGPATIDMWDLKVGHSNGGPFQEISTKTPGLKISEQLPQMAKWSERLAIIRSMTTKEGDHGRATHLMRTGQLPMGAIQYPSIGSLLSKELGDPNAELPSFISIAPQRFFNTEAFGSGFLGPKYAPLIVGEGNFGRDTATDGIDDRLKVQNIARPDAVSKEHALARMEMLRDLQEQFRVSRPGAISESHASAYDRATRLMESEAGKVFDLSQEKDASRDKYGRTIFGQGCLLARRVVEQGVPFVEVSLGGWDTHQNNHDQLKDLCGELDKAWSALMADLQDRGLLDSTLIVCMGEFGRTPHINPQKGRDHFPNAWSAVLAGGGINGGQAIGSTSDDGTTVEKRPTSVHDLLATACLVLGVNYDKQNMSNVGRPIRIVDQAAQPIKEVIA
jgi:hypothetical protein